MIEFETTVRIARDPGQVFSVLADFETYLARWAKGPVAAARTDGDGGAGSHYTITARAGPGLEASSGTPHARGASASEIALKPRFDLAGFKQAVVAGAGWCRRP